MAAIFHLSSQSQPLPELTAHVWDKLLHATEYSLLAALLCRAFRGEGLGWLRAILLAVVCTSAYGVSDEWHQMFVPMRDSDIRDWLADTIGSGVGAVLYARVSSLVRSHIAGVHFD
jgi:VanZ family protein